MTSINRETGIVITSEQLATAPEPVREWLRGLLGDDERLKRGLVLERHGAMSSGDGLAICTSGEINQLLHLLGNDLLGCEILFELGCNYYDPASGAHRERTVMLMDFIHHTDAVDIFDVDSALDRINAVLRRIRDDRDATICRPDGNGGYRVHKTTQHVIYQFWRHLVTMTARRRARLNAA